MYDPYYGWTWVDAAPWGWAPYHYGRWVHVSGYWGWAPGPVVVRPRYAPALVAFFGGGGVSGGFSIGAPRIGWVALGWGEPIVPWWGPLGWRGVPHWAGWGGPHIVNNVVVNHKTVINVNDIRHYRHRHRHDAFVAVDRKHFGHRDVAKWRVKKARAEKYAHVRGDLNLRPHRKPHLASKHDAHKRPAKRHERFSGEEHGPRVASVSKRERRRSEAGSKHREDGVRRQRGNGEHATPQETPRHRGKRSREASGRKERLTRSPSARERATPATPQTRRRKSEPKHTRVARAERPAPKASQTRKRQSDRKHTQAARAEPPAPKASQTRKRRSEPKHTRAARAERPAPKAPQTRKQNSDRKQTRLARAERPTPKAPRATRRGGDGGRASRSHSAKSAPVRSVKKANARPSTPSLPRAAKTRVSRQGGKRSQPKARKAPAIWQTAKASRNSPARGSHGRRR
jgi:hypothetical protein